MAPRLERVLLFTLGCHPLKLRQNGPGRQTTFSEVVRCIVGSHRVPPFPVNRGEQDRIQIVADVEKVT